MPRPISKLNITRYFFQFSFDRRVNKDYPPPCLDLHVIPLVGHFACRDALRGNESWKINFEPRNYATTLLPCRANVSRQSCARST